MAVPLVEYSAWSRFGAVPLANWLHVVAVGVICVLQVPFDGCVQAGPFPVQTSFVQTFPSSVQVVPPGLNPSGGHALPVPVQLSARSHSPAEGRQVVVAGL